MTKDFPAEEKFGLVSQMRRAAVSLACNIVEGFRRKTIKDSLNFYNIAQGSLEELKY
ncbi:MAG: four helix bundle protein [Patescibacteria group bacterium]